MSDGPRGPFGRLLLAGTRDTVGDGLPSGAVVGRRGRRPARPVRCLVTALHRRSRGPCPRLFHGSSRRLALAPAATPLQLAYAQWLLGQRLAQPGFQVAGTTYYTTHSPPGPGFVAPPMAAMPFMAGPWQSPGVAPQQQAPTLQQQQHLMAAAGMMPAPLALRQHSGSSAATP